MKLDDMLKFPAPGRRVVTGLDDSGRSAIISDGPVPEEAIWSNNNMVQGGEIWIENSIPVDISKTKDPLVGYEFQEWPHRGGMIVRMVTWNAGFEYPMHTSNTLDLLWVLSGQLELILEDGSTILNPGDTVVQRRTQHGWRVLGDRPCTAVAVLIDAIPSPSGENLD